MDLKPCPYRRVGDEGHILCEKIKTGNREVSPNVCRACPISQINCAHLRATLDNQTRPPIIVRWGNGRTRVLDDFAQQSISMQRAACAAKVAPIHSARDCAGCMLRQPLVLAESIQPAVRAPSPEIERQRANAGSRPPRRAPTPPAIIPQPVAQTPQPETIAPPVSSQPTADKRTSVVAQKIIQLQEWLAKNVAQKKTDEPQAIAPIESVVRPAVRVAGEEKRVGWTD